MLQIFHSSADQNAEVLKQTDSLWALAGTGLWTRGPQVSAPGPGTAGIFSLHCLHSDWPAPWEPWAHSNRWEQRQFQSACLAEAAIFLLQWNTSFKTCNIPGLFFFFFVKKKKLIENQVALNSRPFQMFHSNNEQYKNSLCLDHCLLESPEWPPSEGSNSWDLHTMDCHPSYHLTHCAHTPLLSYL